MMLYIFDMGGVLARSFDVLPRAAELLGLDTATARELAGLDLGELMAGSIDAAEFWRRFEARSGARAAEDYWSTLFSPTVDAEVERLIRGLRPRGRVVCGTNTIDSHYEHLRASGMYDCFDEVYASHSMGLCKPDPEFWLAILRAEGAEPSEAFFVDDMEENVEAALALGIRSHLFVGVDALRADLAARRLA